jgi:type I restriction enzyme, S subunit
LKNNAPKLRFPEFIDDWKTVEFQDVFLEENDRTNELDKYPLYSLTVESGVTPKSERYERSFLVKNETDNYKIVRNNRFVYNPMNLTIGAVSKHNGSQDVSVSGYYNIFKIKPGFNSDFMEMYIKSHRMINLYRVIATGSLIEKQRVHYSQFIKLKQPLPSLAEQNKIGNLFKQIDTKILKQQEKIEQLEQFKKGMIKRIFSQEIRFKDNGQEFPEWEKVPIKKILSEVVEKTTVNNEYEVLSSTTIGLFRQKDYFNRDIASSDNTGYKILRKGQLVFSPQNLWMGNINYNKSFEVGIVSPSYKIFKINNGFNKELIGFVLKTSKMMYEYMISSEQGASIVRRNLDLDMFYSIKLNLPASELEQRKIANYLSLLDQKLEKEKEKLEFLKVMKKGYLQQMFI